MIFLALVFWGENRLPRGFPQTAVTALYGRVCEDDWSWSAPLLSFDGQCLSLRGQSATLLHLLPCTRCPSLRGKQPIRCAARQLRRLCFTVIPQNLLFFFLGEAKTNVMFQIRAAKSVSLRFLLQWNDSSLNSAAYNY